jgi:LDH2 family malate/lactate/ureidoglycolate dehydrogenase
VDGGYKFGPATGTFTMNKLISKMSAEPIAIANIRNSGHMGMLGYYPEMAANKGVVKNWCAT